MKLTRALLERKTSVYWKRRSTDDGGRNLIDFSVANAFRFPQGFMTTFVTTYRESSVERAEISVLKTLVNNLDDNGAVRTLKGLIHKLYKSNTANATEALLLTDLIGQGVFSPHHIPLVQGIINGQSVAALVDLDDDEALAHLILKKLVNAYVLDNMDTMEYMHIENLFDPNPESPLALTRSCSCSQQ